MLIVTKRGTLVAGAAAVSSILVSPALAVSIVGVSVFNTYSYSFTDAAGQESVGGQQSTHLLSDQRPVPTSQLGVDIVGQADPSSFYFLHNDYCVGKCQITSSTTIRFELFNDEGRGLDSLRFNSLITPGHLALVGLGDYANTSATFAFTVTRTDIPFRESDEPFSADLYTANGSAGLNGLTVVANDVEDPFVNTIHGTNGGAGLYYDWSATPLNVELGEIDNRRGFYLDYTASYTVNSYRKCEDILNCNAAQVIFGDPRSNGGGSEIVAEEPALLFTAGNLAKVADLGSDPLIDGGVHAVINRDYDRSFVPFEFVASGTGPSFATPAPKAPITYVNNYFPALTDTDSDSDVSDVPEPANWMMMIAGLGSVGAMMRRRRVHAIV